MNPNSALPDKWYCKLNDDPMRNKCSAAEETWEEEDEEEEESDDEAYEDLLLAKTKVAAAKAEAKAEERRKSAELPGPGEDDDGTATWGGSQLTAGQQRMLDSDGFVLLPVKQSEAPGVWVGLERLMRTDGKQLGKGKDVGGQPMAYDSLKLARAWKIENSNNSDAYESGVAKVSSHMRKISTSLTGLAPPTGLPAMTAAAAVAALSESKALRPEVNEQLLLHGTSPDVLFSLLSNGLNERFSGTNAGTKFGDGIYFAEDVGKSDQYVTKDAKLEVSSELHQRLYDAEQRHPGSVYYVLACRVALGHSMRTQVGGKGAVSMDTGRPCFPKTFRELSPIEGVSPPIMHHSLIAETGRDLCRYREFITFHGEYVCPEFLLAYHRCSGGAPVALPQPTARAKQAAPARPPVGPTPTYASSSSAPPQIAAATRPPKAKKAKPSKDFSALLRKHGGTFLPKKVSHVDRPFVESRGARWDSAAGMLYAPATVDLSHFARWLPKGALPQLRIKHDDLSRLRRAGGGGIALDVPFGETQEAKVLGARFDWAEKIWWVPEQVTSFGPFAKWLPLNSVPSLDADAQAAARSAAQAQAQAQARAHAHAQAQAQAMQVQDRKSVV
jgi:hypothetical protein